MSLQETGLTIVPLCSLDLFSCSVPVASFMSSFLVAANTNKQAGACSAQSLCFQITPVCAGLAALEQLWGLSKPPSYLPVLPVVAPFRCSLCVLLCGAVFLNFVLAPNCEIYLETKLHM